AVESSGTADRAFRVKGAQKIVAQRLTKKSELNRYWINYAQRHGQVETVPDVTVNPDKGYPLKCPTDQYGNVRPTVPLNYHVQGTACWIMARAMVKVQEYFDNISIDARIVMNVHDEIVIDLPYRANRGNLPKVKN